MAKLSSKSQYGVCDLSTKLWLWWIKKPANAVIYSHFKEERWYHVDFLASKAWDEPQNDKNISGSCYYNCSRSVAFDIWFFFSSYKVQHHHAAYEYMFFGSENEADIITLNGFCTGWFETSLGAHANLLVCLEAAQHILSFSAFCQQAECSRFFNNYVFHILAQLKIF